MSNTFKFSSRSEKNLQGVNPDLVKVTRRALEISEVDFGITEGLRSHYRQKQLVATGKSQTMNSRHLTGHAVDVCGLYRQPGVMGMAAVRKKSQQHSDRPAGN
ncbi:putative phage PS3 [Escherichia coli]|nr:putative phage PS3 [Escherichia coli]